MNRGSSNPTPASTLRSVGFNEAPIHESGKWICASLIFPRCTGFNEAPIHESGKYHRSAARSGSSRCFNEAPIHESGKFGTKSVDGTARNRLQ